MDRGEDVDRRIHEAAMTLLRQHGPAAVTVEAVAALSGVARTTIYRRHKDRNEVLEAALSQHMVSQVGAPGADIWADMLTVLEALQATFDDGFGVGVFLALVQSEDTELVELIRTKLLRTRVDLVVARLRAGVAAGELRADLDVAAAADLLLGAVAARFAHEGAFGPGWAESVVRTLRAGLEAR